MTVHDLRGASPVTRRSRALHRVAGELRAGAVADTALFLRMAFGSLDHMLSQVIGKVYAVAAYAVLAPSVRKIGRCRQC
jgi:hypothetical protein